MTFTLVVNNVTKIYALVWRILQGLSLIILYKYNISNDISWSPVYKITELKHKNAQIYGELIKEGSLLVLCFNMLAMHLNEFWGTTLEGNGIGLVEWVS